MSTEWSDIAFFLASLRTGSFTKAAVLCKVKQSTVSRRVAALEKRLGGSLFNRTTRGLYPTELAEQLLPHAELAEHHIVQMETLSQGHTQDITGTVTLALVPTISSNLVAPALPSWRRKYPGLRIEIVTSLEATNLIRGEADIALRFFRPKHGDLIAKKVATFTQGVVGHKDYIAQFEPPYDPEKLDWITLQMGVPGVPEGDWFRENIRKEPVLKTNDYGTIMEGVRHGLGVAMMSRNIMLLDPNIQDVPLDLPTLEDQHLWLVTHKMLRKVPRVDAIWRELELLCQKLF